MENKTVQEQIDELYEARQFHEEELENIKIKLKELCEDSLSKGITHTSNGRLIAERVRTSRHLNVEMFRLTDREEYDRLISEGLISFPSTVVRELGDDKPYITTKTTKYHVIKD